MTKRANLAVTAARGTTVALDFQVVDADGVGVDCTGLVVTVGLCDARGVEIVTWTVGDAYVDGRGAIWTDILTGLGTFIAGETTSTEVVAARFYQWYIEEDGITLEGSGLLPFTIGKSARP